VERAIALVGADYAERRGTLTERLEKYSAALRRDP